MTTPVAAPAATPTILAPSQPVMPAPAVQTPAFDNGGAMETPNKTWGQYVKTANWVEIGFLILGTAAFLYMIKYYRYRMYTEREDLKKIHLTNDEMKADLIGIKSTIQKARKSRSGF